MELADGIYVGMFACVNVYICILRVNSAVSVLMLCFSQPSVSPTHLEALPSALVVVRCAITLVVRRAALYFSHATDPDIVTTDHLNGQVGARRSQHLSLVN